MTVNYWHSTSLWFWPLFWPLGLLASMFGLFPSLYFGLFCIYKGQNTNWKRDQTLRPKDQEAKKERPKDQEAKNERPKWHYKYTQYKASGKKTCPSLSEASDRLSVPYQLSLFTHPDANDRLSVPHQLSLFTQPRIPEELSLQAKISNLGWCKFIESIKFSLCCINIFFTNFVTFFTEF